MLVEPGNEPNVKKTRQGGIMNVPIWVWVLVAIILIIVILRMV